MESEQPTKEELEKFWTKWCGFERMDYLDTSGKVCATHWVHSLAVGGGNSSLPPLDLNNIFKFAVPKLVSLGYHVEIYVKELGGRLRFWVSIKRDDKLVGYCSKSELADAVFWAVWGII